MARKPRSADNKKLRPPFNKRRRLLLERCAIRQQFVYVKIAVARFPLTAEPRTTRPLQTARKCIREQLKPHPTGPKKIRNARMGARFGVQLRQDGCSVTRTWARSYGQMCAQLGAQLRPDGYTVRSAARPRWARIYG